MKIILAKSEYWIKDDTVLPSNFYSMRDNEKQDYIYDNNLIHRINGPAIIDLYGTKWWCLNGLCHRLDEPAIINIHGTKWWYLDDQKVDGEIYKKIENSSKEELLMYAVLPKYKDYIPLIDYRLNKK